MEASAGWCVFSPDWTRRKSLFSHNLLSLSSALASVRVRASRRDHPQRDRTRRKLHRHHVTSAQGDPDVRGLPRRASGKVRFGRMHHLAHRVHRAEDHAPSCGKTRSSGSDVFQMCVGLIWWRFVVVFVSGAGEEDSGPHRDVSGGERPCLLQHRHHQALWRGLSEYSSV